MKKLLCLLAIAAILISCGDTTNNNITRSPGIIPDPPAGTPDTPPVIMALYNGTTVKFYDGDNFTDWKTGKAAYAGNGIISVDDKLYYLDAYGREISTDFLPVAPDYIAVNGADIYLFEKILPADALAAGALYKDYTNVYKNGATINHWSANQWETVAVTVTYADVVAHNSTGSLHPVSGSYSAVTTAVHYGPLIIDYDGIGKTATFKYDFNYSESWAGNFMSSAKYWQRADGIFYSNNGNEWSAADGLIEQANAMTDFNSWPYPTGGDNGETPYIISAGANYESGETVLYWLDCNTGKLYRYIPSIDSVEYVSRLYIGDGTRLSGTFLANDLKPVMIAENIYYHNQGSIFQCDTSTGNVSTFYAADVEVWKF